MPTKARHCVLLSLFCNWSAQFKVFQFHLDWFLIALCIFSCMLNDPCLPQEAVREPMEFAHCALLASIHCCNGLWPCCLSHFIVDFYGDLILFVPPDLSLFDCFRLACRFSFLFVFCSWMQNAWLALLDVWKLKIWLASHLNCSIFMPSDFLLILNSLLVSFLLAWNKYQSLSLISSCNKYRLPKNYQKTGDVSFCSDHAMLRELLLYPTVCCCKQIHGVNYLYFCYFVF